MNAQTVSADKPLARWIVGIGFALAVIGAVAAVLSGFGYQWDLWGFRTGFKIIKWSAMAAIGAIAMSSIGLAIASRKVRSTLVMSVLGIIIGGVTFYIPWSWKQTLEDHPYIHDISTNLDNPPQFVAVASIRGAGAFPRISVEDDA